MSKLLKMGKTVLLLLSILLIRSTTIRSSAQTHNENLKTLRKMKAIEKAIVLLNNRQAIIPVRQLEKRKIVSISFGLANQISFDSLLNKYSPLSYLNADKYKDSTDLNDLEDDLKYYNTVIVAIDNSEVSIPKVQNFLEDISKRKDLIIAFFGDGSSLKNLNRISTPVIWCPKNNLEASIVVPQIIFGGIAAEARLAQRYSTQYPKGAGYTTLVTRLKYTIPEEVGINSNDLLVIDSIAGQAIREQAAPGMVVLAATHGKVIFNKAYGYHTYAKILPDKVSDIFDMASVTKITATTPVVMHLVEEGRLSLDSTIGYYLARARKTPMNKIQVREVMLHQAGFIPFIPFQSYLKPSDHSADSSAAYPTKVANCYYIKKDFFNNYMWPKMLYSPIVTRGKYVYSDISMYVMQQIVEQLTETPLNTYVLRKFYYPLGMHSTGYLPLNRFGEDRIIPTEDDTSFRKTLLLGTVHDEGAALKGGVAGHAGLFANSIDLATYYQMLLNKGNYGGKQYFKPSTVETFIKKESKVSRRGYGFDRADRTQEYPSKLASSQTFGHTGYTGTCVWVDPSRDLVFIFLSNRVNPIRSTVLYKLNVRSHIQDVFNRAIDDAKRLQ